MTAITSHHSVNPFLKWAVFLKFVETTRDIQFKNDTFGPVSSFFLLSVINCQSLLLLNLPRWEILTFD